jgi:hypothetical protein
LDIYNIFQEIWDDLGLFSSGELHNMGANPSLGCLRQVAISINQVVSWPIFNHDVSNDFPFLLLKHLYAAG